jgi:uncharacterized protein (TIGR02598 family)
MHSSGSATRKHLFRFSFVLRNRNIVIMRNGAEATTRKHPQRFSRGFSLVEVVIAMGIVVFAFIPLLGLIPMGLNTSRQAVDTTVEAQIVQQMTSQVQQTAFSSLTGLNNEGLLYFDANGNTISSASGAVYKACFSVTTSASNSSLPNGTVLPGGSTTQALTTVTVYVLSTRTPGGMTAQTLQDLTGNSATKKYFVLVANNGL